MDEKIYFDALWEKNNVFNQYIDSYVLLTEEMKEVLNVGDKPYTIVEGILNSNAISTCTHDTKKRIIFYSGTLDLEFGIDVLLEAFSQISDTNIELWICGSGNAEQLVIKAAKGDKRITFWGYCSYEKVKELREQSSVLVNPRNCKGEFTRYSFPSKTIEYLSSGIPVVMYKLEGIPKEYDEYIYYVQGNNSIALRDKLLEVLELSDDAREKIGKKAQEFILLKKNDKFQVKKILDMIRKEII